MAEKVTKRNIIILGKTGCGKSTLANKILNAERFHISSAVSSDTAEIQSETNTVKIEGELYQITVTDTVGFFDTTQRQKRFNNEIMKNIISELTKVAPYGLNLIIFVFKNGRFTLEERESFEIITQHFQSLIEKASMLVITNCGKNRDSREKAITDFKYNRFTKPFADMMQKGICTVDFPDISEYDEEIAAVYRPRIQTDQAALHKVIATADSRFLAEELKNAGFWNRLRSIFCPFL